MSGNAPRVWGHLCFGKDLRGGRGKVSYLPMGALQGLLGEAAAKERKKGKEEKKRREKSRKKEGKLGRKGKKKRE